MCVSSYLHLYLGLYQCCVTYSLAFIGKHTSPSDLFLSTVCFNLSFCAPETETLTLTLNWDLLRFRHKSAVCKAAIDKQI